MNVLFVFLLLSIEISFSLKCTVQFKRSKVCKIYKYNEDCFQGKVEFCELIAIKKNQNKCPHYVCDFFQNSSSAVLSNLSSAEQNQTITNRLFTNNSSTTENSSFIGLNETILIENLTPILLNDTFKSEITTNQSFQDSVLSEKLFPTLLNDSLKSEISTDKFRNDFLLTENPTSDFENNTYLTNNASEIDFEKFLSNENSTNLVNEINVSGNLSDTLLKNTSNSESSIFFKDFSSVFFNNSVLKNNQTNLKKNVSLKDNLLKSEIESSSLFNSTKKEIDESLKFQNKSFFSAKFKDSLTNNSLTNTNQSNYSNNSFFSEQLTINETNAILSNSSANVLLSRSSLNSLNTPVKNNRINVSLPEHLKTSSEANSFLNLNDLKNWKELETIRNFSSNHILEKSRLRNHFKESLDKKQEKLIDKSNSSKVTKINELNKSEDFKKPRLHHFRQTSRIKQFFFQKTFDRLFSKMPIDCGEKTCSLEFQERQNVR